MGVTRWLLTALLLCFLIFGVGLVFASVLETESALGLLAGLAFVGIGGGGLLQLGSVGGKPAVGNLMALPLVLGYGLFGAWIVSREPAFLVTAVVVAVVYFGFIYLFTE